MEQMALPLQGGDNIAGASRMYPNPYDYGRNVSYLDKMTGYEVGNRLHGMGMPEANARELMNLGKATNSPVDPALYRNIQSQFVRQQALPPMKGEQLNLPHVNPHAPAQPKGVVLQKDFIPKTLARASRLVRGAGPGALAATAIGEGASAVADKVMFDPDTGHRSPSPTWGSLQRAPQVLRPFASGGFIDPKMFAARLVPATTLR